MVPIVARQERERGRGCVSFPPLIANTLANTVANTVANTLAETLHECLQLYSAPEWAKTPIRAGLTCHDYDPMVKGKAGRVSHQLAVGNIAR